MISAPWSLFRSPLGTALSQLMVAITPPSRSCSNAALPEMTITTIPLGYMLQTMSHGTLESCNVLERNEREFLIFVLWGSLSYVLYERSQGRIAWAWYITQPIFSSPYNKVDMWASRLRADLSNSNYVFQIPVTSEKYIFLLVQTLHALPLLPWGYNLPQQASFTALHIFTRHTHLCLNPNNICSLNPTHKHTPIILLRPKCK